MGDASLASCRAERLQRTRGGVTILTSMQWFYGPTWGRTLRVCGHGTQTACAQWDEVHARQMELVEVLRRNLAHPAVQEVHVLVGEVEPVRHFLRRLPWYHRKGCLLNLIGTGTRPKFKDYLAHIGTALLGRPVVMTNQDVFLGDGWWDKLPASLPPKTAFLLSRYHQRVTYDTQHSWAAGLAEGLFNRSAAFPARRKERPSLGVTIPSSARASRRTCDMAAPRMAVWSRSLCHSRNFGSYDAYVLRLDAPLSAEELALFDYPQNAWGGENVFQYLLQEALLLKTRNPCLGLKALHMHCELPTTFSGPKVGDRRMGKLEIALAAQRKLRAMGRTVTMDARDIGSLALNVTYT